MEKGIFEKTSVLAAVLAAGAFAVEPNYVASTIFNVNDSGHNIVSTRYIDGMARGIQTKIRISDTTDQVACNYFDSVGRPTISTKPFVDGIIRRQYLPGGIASALVKNQLEGSNLGDTRAFSETFYWDDPLGSVRTSIGPGAAYVGNTVKRWTFGVGDGDTTITFSAFSPVFHRGFIRSNISEPLLDSMRDNFSKGSAGFGLPQFFLTVTKDPQNVFTQELNDAFGRTVASRSMDSAGGSEIIPSYKFDILDNTLKEISPAADTNPIDTSRYRYNTLGQMIREQTPDGGEFTYDYNNDGTLSNEMLWNKSGMYMGLEYSYDSLSRLIQIKRILVGKASVEVVRNYYDTVLYAGKSPFTSIPLSVFDEMSNLKGRLAATVGRNHLDGDIISVGKFYSYDEEGRISRKITAMSGSPIYQESRFEYDIHGKTVAEYFSYSGDRIKKKFIYDQMGRLARVIQCIYPDGADSCTDKELVRNEYDDLDKLTHKTFSAIMPGTYRTSNIFDIRDRLINLIPGGSKGFGEAIRYTPTGNIDSASYVYSLGSGMDTTFSCAYAYDNINRLVSAATNNGMTSTDNTYSYDAVGRFRSKKEGSSNLTGYKYFAANSRLRKTSKNPAAGQEYVYDAFGNLVVDFTKKMIIENDWRCQPVIYSFYNDLSTAGISRDSTGVYNGAIDLYTQMQNKVKAGAIAIVSKVKMIYDADGNRVCKMEAR